MLLATTFFLLGLYCLFIAPKYKSVIGFRGILYLLNRSNSWATTNRLFGIELIIFSSLLFFTQNTKLFVLLIVFSLLTTDLLSYLYSQQKKKSFSKFI
ncbi:hypothetical protein [Vagococcus bubulae]|uniref:SdpI family protein n=1 Tax=Vagococcus bubulae TaxID=1977868 RepID=A0A429ZK42_9ENTE|nr:hypothetical protein [Vagococcus bubulae]RST94051.1 hypothetical protein CBF36_06640 [Vagococcus bubulae]